MDWKKNILTTDEQLHDLLAATKRIAVIGIKPESRSDQAAYYVPKYMSDKGYEIVPVPVYYPELTEIMGVKVYRTLQEIPGEIDMVNVFRRSQDVAQHVPDILAAKPRSVWIQMGIRDDDSAETLAKAGIKVVQDMCLMVVERMLMRR